MTKIQKLEIRRNFWKPIKSIANLIRNEESMNHFPLWLERSKGSPCITFIQHCTVCPAAAAAKSLQSCPTVWPHRWQPPRLPHPWDSPGKNTGVGCHFLLQCMKVKSESESEVAQSSLTLRDPMDCSLPGSSIHGIFQARVLEWGAIAFSVLCTKSSEIMKMLWRNRNLHMSSRCIYKNTLTGVGIKVNQ